MRGAPVRDAVLGFAGLQVSRCDVSAGAAVRGVSGVSRRRAFARFPACDAILGFAGLQVPRCDASAVPAGRLGAAPERLRGSRLVTLFWALPVCRFRGAMSAQVPRCGVSGVSRRRAFARSPGS
ncbi:hypothetical protein [Yeguia hominis]|uniref:Uncharacterized protein n=1 Tax=Yeguia hominis TaxID=2763662 RepID=A0A926D696_9FIRM|nr:hypothetical protein [Yeguia hominis]MBC8533185.1 hypothetical protein [Yeguia hominis]